METVISQLPEVPNQVGFAILVPKGVGSLECFDLPDSWKVMGKSLIEKEELIIKVVEIGDVGGRKGVSFQLEKITP